jgi:hypothetical protein
MTKYQFSVSIYDDQFPEGETNVTKELHAESYEDACFQGRSVVFNEIPNLAHRGIIPDTVRVNSRFDLEKVSED